MLRLKVLFGSSASPFRLLLAEAEWKIHSFVKFSLKEREALRALILLLLIKLKVWSKISSL